MRHPVAGDRDSDSFHVSERHQRYRVPRVGASRRGGRTVSLPPGLGRVRRITGAEAQDNFVGSDFTYEDISGRELDDYTLLDGRAERDMDRCRTGSALPAYRIESRAKDAQARFPRVVSRSERTISSSCMPTSTTAVTSGRRSTMCGELELVQSIWTLSEISHDEYRRSRPTPSWSHQSVRYNTRAEGGGFQPERAGAESSGAPARELGPREMCSSHLRMVSCWNWCTTGLSSRSAARSASSRPPARLRPRSRPLTSSGLTSSRFDAAMMARTSGARHAERDQRHLQHLVAEIEDEEHARGLAVDRQHEAPVLDLVVGVRPLVRDTRSASVIAFVFVVLRLTNSPEIRPCAHFRVVRQQHAVRLRLHHRQLRVGERLALPVQVRVREVADVVDDHRVVRAPGEVERDRAPRPRPFELGDVGDLPLARERADRPERSRSGRASPARGTTRCGCAGRCGRRDRGTSACSGPRRRTSSRDRRR